MKPARLLIIVFALAVLANARVALLPGWVVPVPVVILAVTLAVTAVLAGLIVLRLHPPRMPAAPAAGPGTAVEVAK